MNGPRDDKGHFVPLECPDLDCDGRLELDGDGIWQCNGLVGRGERELFACAFGHQDGKPYDPTVTP